jgi:hypothetical protein
MLPPHHKILEIIENAQFADELAELQPNAIRADEFMDGAVRVLSRNPTYGTQLGKHVWFLPMFSGHIVLYYTFDDDHVYFLSIQVSKAKGDEEE